MNLRYNETALLLRLPKTYEHGAALECLETANSQYLGFPSLIRVDLRKEDEFVEFK